MRKALAISLLMAVGGFVYAGTESHLQRDEPDLTVCERALPLLSKGDKAGFDILAEEFHAAGDDRFGRAVGSLHGLLQSQVSDLGEPCGIELVGAETVGNSLRRYTYLSKYQTTYIRWQFTFYRPFDEWRVYGWDFKTNPESIFADCGSALPLPENAAYSVAEKPQATPER